MTHHDLMHGLDYDGQCVTGWLVQEKFNGLRAYWDGSALYSREGKRFNAPSWFTKGLPDLPLDGELYAGVGTLSRLATRLARWKSGKDEDWLGVKLHVFDAPSVKDGFETRAQVAAASVRMARHGVGVETVRVGSPAELRRALKALHAVGGEGFMIREPAAHYVAGRTESLLKFKCPMLAA